MDDRLSKTDACEVALRFCLKLGQREVITTASHLRIVQEAVRDFAVAVSPSPDERILLLEHRKGEIQREIDGLHQGIVPLLSEAEQHERLREIYQLASVLTGDFRRVEDEIRELDQAVRVQMIESSGNRGEILLQVFNKEKLVAETDAGRAFEGFFQLLCDQNRTTEFREQLRNILSRPVAESLSSQQHQFLASCSGNSAARVSAYSRSGVALKKVRAPILRADPSLKIEQLIVYWGNWRGWRYPSRRGKLI